MLVNDATNLLPIVENIRKLDKLPIYLVMQENVTEWCRKHIKLISDYYIPLAIPVLVFAFEFLNAGGALMIDTVRGGGVKIIIFFAFGDQ